MKHLTLHNYLPKPALDLVEQLLLDYHFNLKIKNNRKTKHGDFRPLKNGNFQITINGDMNNYRFLITLIHEIAHLKTYKESTRVKPHGIEWKINFQHLMMPFLNPKIFPKPILTVLANYLRNPKASTDSDIKLSLILNQYDENTSHNYIFELPIKSNFKYNNRIFEKGGKRRVRFECLEVKTKKKYLFHPNAKVEPINN